MSSLLQGLNDYLTSFDEIKQALPNRCIFAFRFPRQAGDPSVSVRRISSDAAYALEGEHECGVSIVQLEVRGTNYKNVSDVEEKIRLRISGYRGMMGNVDVKACTKESGPLDIAEKPDDGSDVWMYRTITDYRITFAQDDPVLNAPNIGAGVVILPI